MGNAFSFETFNGLVRQGSAAREDSYLNSPLYYALTARGRAVVHQGYGAVMVVCPHPHKPDCLLAFPEIGPADGQLAASVLSNIEPPAGGVQLARYNEDDLFKLREAFARKNDCRVEALKVIEENSLDWRYPVHILDTGRVAAAQGPAFEKIRNKCRKVEGHVEIITLQDPGALRAMRAAQRYWEGSMVMRERDQGDISGFYESLFAMVAARPDQFNGLVFMMGRRPVGFSLYDRPFMKTANVLASLSDASVAGLSDYQVVATCRAMHATGILYANYGGSEHQTLDQFKRKFIPHKSLPVFSAEVQYAVRADVNVQSAVLAL